MRDTNSGRDGARRHSTGSVFHLSSAKKELEVIPYRVKTGGRVRLKLSWPGVIDVVQPEAERGVKMGLIKELICD